MKHAKKNFNSLDNMYGKFDRRFLRAGNGSTDRDTISHRDGRSQPLDDGSNGFDLGAMLTQTATQCPSCIDSDLMTAAMATALTTFPTNKPPEGVTVVPIPGDLGWGSVYGRIIDGTNYLPIVGATVKCDQPSYTSLILCNGVTTTDQYGRYRFSPVYFNNADLITLTVEALGYEPSYFTESSRIRPEVQADLALFPLGGSLTSTPFVSCTPPVCTQGILTCGDANGCPGGCGSICQLISPTP